MLFFKVFSFLFFCLFEQCSTFNSIFCLFFVLSLKSLDISFKLLLFLFKLKDFGFIFVFSYLKSSNLLCLIIDLITLSFYVIIKSFLYSCVTLIQFLLFLFMGFTLSFIQFYEFGILILYLGP